MLFLNDVANMHNKAQQILIIIYHSLNLNWWKEHDKLINIFY